MAVILFKQKDSKELEIEINGFIKSREIVPRNIIYSVCPCSYEIEKKIDNAYTETKSISGFHVTDFMYTALLMY